MFEPDARLWSIWWVDGRAPCLEPPVRGRFEDGVGRFFGDDELAGRSIRVRFVWSEITPRSARWDQAFSVDGGASWQANWTMLFTRLSGPADADAEGLDEPQQPAGIEQQLRQEEARRR